MGHSKGGAAAPAAAYTAVMAVRGTDRELSFLPRSIPACLAAGPAEVLFAVDAPVREPLRRAIEAQVPPGDSKCRILEVPPDAAFRFRLASVTDRAIREARSEWVLIVDADMEIGAAVLAGLGACVGGGLDLCSLAKRHLIRRPGDAVRYASSRLNSAVSGDVYTGLFWLRKEAYLRCVDTGRLRGIRNGIDTFVLEEVERCGGRARPMRAVGGRCLDYRSADYDWAQFSLGMWLGSRPGLRPAAKAALITAMYCYPHVARGWAYARRNPDAPGVRGARECGTVRDLQYRGDTLVSGIGKWRDTGRTGMAEGS